MARLVEIRKNPKGFRFYVLGGRVHHGLVGVTCSVGGALLNKAYLVRLGAMLISDDAADFPFSFRDK